MNKSKAVTAMIMLAFSVALSVFFSINANEINPENSGGVSGAVINSDKKASTGGENIAVKKSEKYFLVIEGNMLCAYRISGDARECVDRAQIDTALVDSDDLQKLNEGISAESFEELCMYFEAYTS